MKVKILIIDLLQIISNMKFFRVLLWLKWILCTRTFDETPLKILIFKNFIYYNKLLFSLYFLYHHLISKTLLTNCWNWKGKYVFHKTCILNLLTSPFLYLQLIFKSFFYFPPKDTFLIYRWNFSPSFPKFNSHSFAFALSFL